MAQLKDLIVTGSTRLVGTTYINGFTLNKTVPADAVFTDTVYTHPTTAGNKHIPSGGETGQFLGWNSNGTAKWVSNPNTDIKCTETGHYDPTTEDTSALKSAGSGKYISSIKLDSNYHVVGIGTSSLPTFSESYLGTVTSITPGTGLTGTSKDEAITSSGTINLKTSGISEIGGIKIAKDNANYTVTTKTSSISANISSGKYYGVEIDKDDKAFVYVPWDANTWRTIKCNGTSIGSNELNLKPGTNITLSNTNGAITINSSAEDGSDGRGITSISKTSTSGKTDTYTITYTDSTTSTFTVTNGTDGKDGEDGADGKDGTTPTEYVSSFNNKTGDLESSYSATIKSDSTGAYTIGELTIAGTKHTLYGKDTNTTYTSKSAASGGTAVSLVTTGEKYTWGQKGTYSKPPTGIPKNDLASAVQTSLGKADSALQAASLDGYATEAWVGEQNYTTATGHTHNYAGSSSAGGSATSAVKLDTATAGSATKPCYFTSGKPSACTYSLNATVPSTAVFTDVNVTTTATTSTTFYVAGSSSSSTTTGTLYKGSGVKVQDGKKLYASEGFFQSSDENLKNFHGSIPVDLDKLSELRKDYFTWKEDENKDMQIGVSAQEVQKLYPELVSEDTETGKLTVAYDKLSVVALAAIDKLYNENKELRERLERIESILNAKN